MNIFFAILWNMANEKTSDEISPEARAYMSKLGSKRTPAKIEAARKNALKGAATRRKDPLTVPCTCEGATTLEAKAHKSTCPRGRMLYQRERRAEKANA
jgi:hypothetical protein